MPAQPWMQFFPADWRSDPGLRTVSIAARGLWIDMIALMHDADPYGHLTINGRPMVAKAIAKAVGEPEKDVTRLLDELREAGVFSETDADPPVIYSRRMVRDFDRAEKARINGAKGGNPAIKGKADASANSVSDARSEVNPPLNPRDNRGVRTSVKPGNDPDVNGTVKPRDKPIYQRSDIRNHNINSVPRDPARDLGSDLPLVFPSDGSIEFSQPWADEARKAGRNIDLNLLASAFRKWLFGNDIPFDAPGMLERWKTFVRKHKV